MKIKISELEGAALDWAVGVATKTHITMWVPGGGRPGVSVFEGSAFGVYYSPSTSWSQCGPLIDSMNIFFDERWGQVMAWTRKGTAKRGIKTELGETRLQAACRVIVCAHTDGDTVEVPDELVEVKA